MPASRPPLSYDVFVAPEKPFTAPARRVGDPPAWDPTTSTLIFGARDAVLPDLGLIISGDVAYNHCHMFVGATTADSRAEWIAALDQLAALNPAAVVTGHKDPTRGNPPSVLSESRGYLEYYGQLREAALSEQDLFDAMVSRYPDWVSRQQFLLFG
jgi:hypothetical protein